MSTRSNRSDELERVRRQLEQWRRRRDPGQRIPESLWKAAVKLARKHGVSKTRDALRLDYYSIKKRLAVADRASSAITSPASGAGSEDRDRFVELPLRTMPGLSLAPRTCVLEAEDGRGARLHLELQGLGAGELAGVVRAVWGEPG